MPPLLSPALQVRCPSSSMPQVTDMVRTLSPLARLDEMHPTLAKFSIPAGRQIEGDVHVGTTASLHDAGVSGDGKTRRRVASGGGLSLAAAFESIEARKKELQVRGSAAGVAKHPPASCSR